MPYSWSRTSDDDDKSSSFARAREATTTTTTGMELALLAFLHAPDAVNATDTKAFLEALCTNKTTSFKVSSSYSMRNVK